MKWQELKINHWYKYHDGVEGCNAKVIGFNRERQIVYFIDDEGFEWEETFDDIEETVERGLPFK